MNINVSPDVIFISQFIFSLVVLGFTGTMMIVDKENLNIYLPVFTSIAFTWLPSPMSSRPSKEDNNNNNNGSQPKLLTGQMTPQTFLPRYEEISETLSVTPESEDQRRTTI